ncbi:UPF0149 family protein [Sphingobium sp. BS19]|uniref:UPF0149 family protein n=1 Tax=Sphingobium sp. BS19 TaxID=3018973 RepID=UPI0022EF1CFA|nr:UPF0149 family protein [Sphingobium sp. BS19]GLJ00623.1 hypothetical protein Sbs19_44410 [Sphingobium sp. BS19]
MSSSRFKRPAKPAKARILTREKLEEWLANLDPQAANVSMIDGYLAALVVSPQFIPPEEWLLPILSREVANASDDSIEGIVRSTIFQRYSQIGATLSGGPKRYAPIFMRTDDEEVLLQDFANGFYLGMRLSIDDWKPFMSDREIGMPMMAILVHCTTMISEDKRTAAIDEQAAEILAESWRVVPEVLEMLHVNLAGSRNIEIR